MVSFGLLDTKTILKSAESFSNNVPDDIIYSYEEYMDRCEQDILIVSRESRKIYDDYIILKEEVTTIANPKSLETLLSMEGNLSSIKNFFIKTWQFIVQVFEKLRSMITNMIKSLIIFVKKSQYQKNKNGREKVYENIIKNVTKFNADPNSNGYRAMNEKLENVKVASFNNKTFNELCNCVSSKNKMFMEFIKSQKSLNLTDNALLDIQKEALREVKEVISKDTSVNKTIATMDVKTELNVEQFMLTGRGRMPSLLKKFVTTRVTNSDNEKSGSTSKNLANRLLFDTTSTKKILNSSTGFFNGGTNTVPKIVDDYRVFDSNMDVILDIILKSIQECKKHYDKDSKIVKEIQNELINKVTSMKEENTEKYHRIRSITDTVLKLKTMKQQFIEFRYDLLLTLFNIKNTVDKNFNSMAKVCGKFPDVVKDHKDGKYNVKTVDITGNELV